MITVFLMVFIFLQSALPADLSQQESNAIVTLLTGLLPVAPKTLSFVIRKSAHFMEYLLLGMSLFVTVREYFPVEERIGAVRFGLLLPWGIGTLYALTDEIHQRFVPGRSCEARDVLIDSCGVAAGVLVMVLIRRAGEKKRRP